MRVMKTQAIAQANDDDDDVNDAGDDYDDWQFPILLSRWPTHSVRCRVDFRLMIGGDKIGFFSPPFLPFLSISRLFFAHYIFLNVSKLRRTRGPKTPNQRANEQAVHEAWHIALIHRNVSTQIIELRVSENGEKYERDQCSNWLLRLFLSFVCVRVCSTLWRNLSYCTSE